MRLRNKTRPRIARKPACQWYVLEGDWSGQVYATVPKNLVPGRYAETRLWNALRLMDRLCWECNDGGGTSLLLDSQTPTERTTCRWSPQESFVRGWKLAGRTFGGAGGGRLVHGDLWLHPEILGKGLPFVNRVRAIIGLRPLKSLQVTWGEYDACYAPADHPLRMCVDDGPIAEVE